MSESFAIRLKQVQFAWPRSPALIHIDAFEMACGERVFLHGPSGSGKSTLLALIGGVLEPQHGNVEVLGRDLVPLRRARRDQWRADHIGFIFQLFNLLPYLSVLENTLLPCRFSRLRSARASDAGGVIEQARYLLGQLKIEPQFYPRSVARLSIGQQQRVAAARALIGAPELIIADEPTSSLDYGARRAFLDLLLAQCQKNGAGILFVSHDPSLAEHFDRSVALPDINTATLP